jgi:DNA-binding winged helix-turn-helix (wHTH) protein/tetratricopeptide (TPR) repeat protein
MTSYRFGPFLLDPDRRQLERSGARVALTSKVFDLLALLVQNAGRVLTKDELISSLWPDTIVEESNLTQNIAVLRKALGPPAGDSSSPYIETIARVGYLFTGEVRRHHPHRDEQRSSPDQRLTLAILPFQYYGGTESDIYLGVGIADALITRLSRIRNILVRPTNNVIRYTEISNALVAGRELRVDNLLHGAIYSAGGKMRVTAQLIDVTHEETLWAGQYDLSGGDVIMVQDKITELVTNELPIVTTVKERRQALKGQTASAEACREYMKGRYFWNKRTEDGFKSAIECFNRAIDIDPLYAQAYVGLADSYKLLNGYGAMSSKDAVPKARAAVMKALEIDDTLAEAHAAMGQIKLTHDYDLQGAEKEIKRAIELNSNYATAQHWHAIVLRMAGRFDEALEAAAKAHALDPLSQIIGVMYALNYFHAGRVEEAIEQCHKALELNESFYVGYAILGLIHGKLGLFDEAVNYYKKAVSPRGFNWEVIAIRGYMYGRAGKVTQAREILNELEEGSKKSHVPPICMAYVYMGLGENDKAFEWLEKAYEDRAGDLMQIRITYLYDSLRSDPRFQDLERRIFRDD